MFHHIGLLIQKQQHSRHHRLHHGARRLAAALLTSLLTLVPTACSSAGGTKPTSTPSFSSSELDPAVSFGSATDTGAPPTEQDNSTTDQPNGLNYIGSFTVASPGASITTKVSVGTPTPNTQGQPPADVLTACNWNYTTSIAQSVYIHGSLTISYTGSIAESISIGDPTVTDLTDSLLLGGTVGASVGIQGPDGSWKDCGDLDGGWNYVLQPGATVTADMWIDDGILSNAHPTFEPSDSAPLAMQFAAGGTPTSASGPNAANCTVNDGSPQPTLLLYSTPPYNFQAKDVDGNDHGGRCTPA